ncbi:unnamed protein product, partial [marine sediment metagenome]
DTGPLTFAVRRDRFDFLHELLIQDGKTRRPILAADAQSGPYIVDGSGTVYRSRTATPDTVVLEERGPLRAVIRAEGWFVSDAGVPKCRYLVRLHAYAGLPFVRVLFTG